jgi:hypothetical protein
MATALINIIEMDLKRFSFARQILPATGAAVAMAFLTGCATMSLTNLTPSSLPENPSGIYTFTLRATPKSVNVVVDTVAPHVVVGEQTHDMKKSDEIPGIYEFDYRLPPGQTSIGYYYLVNYQVTGNSVVDNREAYTPVFHASVVSRYVLSLEVNRGPVGARIGVLGRGFTPQDLVGFDGTPVRTVYESPTSLGFYVPALTPGKAYRVTVSGATGNSPVGTFKIDSSDVTVEPAALTLTPGQKQSVTFTISHAAPAGGLLLDVTTDIPESVIMPEVVVPEGQMSAAVTVQGGKPGTGSLFLKGYGNGEVSVPVTVGTAH